MLGLYYKLQSFFFIPLFGLQTCIVPVISFNLARKNYSRCKRTMNLSFLISALFMVLGVICFVFFPRQMVDVFSNSQEVHDIGAQAFPIIGASFLPAVFSLMMPVFFQAIGAGVRSVFLSLLRQIVCLVPIFWAFSFLGLQYTWLSFPISECISGGIGLLFYGYVLRQWKHSTT